ncbi:unnamed protein product [Urochloa humidicola]
MALLNISISARPSDLPSPVPSLKSRLAARYILTELAAHAVLRLRRTYRAEMGICVGTAAGERVPPTTAASVTSSIDGFRPWKLLLGYGRCCSIRKLPATCIHSTQ